jgi:nitrate/nitrite-specific signal transduction histidine kinase
MEANGRATEGDEAERRELERKTHELNERLKELNCLYEISDIMEQQRLASWPPPA